VRITVTQLPSIKQTGSPVTRSLSAISEQTLGKPRAGLSGTTPKNFMPARPSTAIVPGIA